MVNNYRMYENKFSNLYFLLIDMSVKDAMKLMSHMLSDDLKKEIYDLWEVSGFCSLYVLCLFIQRTPVNDFSF